MAQLQSGTTIAGYLALHYGNDGHIASFINLSGNDLQLQHRDGTVLDTVDLASYITGHVDITPGSSVAAQTGGNVISQLTLDADGHTTLTATRNMWAEKHILTKENNANNWTHDSVGVANISLELGTNSAGGVGSLKMWSYTANEYVFMRPSNGNYHIDATTNTYYFGWDDDITSAAGKIILGDINGAAGITLNASSASVFTSSITWSGGSSANANTAYGWGNHASGGYLTSTHTSDVDAHHAKYTNAEAISATAGTYLAIGGKAADSEKVDGINGASLLRSDAQDAYTPMALYLGTSANWDVGNQNGSSNTNNTNLHFQGHGDFWIGAGNSSWYTTPVTSHHDLLINTMQNSGANVRGITFTASLSGVGVYKLGRWFSSTTAAASHLDIYGALNVTGNISGANLNISNWDTAHGWGDHASGGYGPAAGSTSIVTVGTIATGTWQGTAIAAGYMASHAPASHAFSVHTGTLGVSQGGTGAGTHTSGNVLIGAGTGAITSLSRSGIDTRSTFPATSHAFSVHSGTLGVSQGGTGAGTHTSGNVLIGAGTGAVTSLSRSGIDTRSTFPSASHAFSVHSGTLAVSQGGTGLTSGYNKTNWDLAHGWGDHGTEGYITTTGVTHTALNNNGDIGTGASQVANGDHSHSEFGALAVIDNYFWVKHSSSADAEGIRMAITSLTDNNTSSEIFFVENGALSYGAKIAYDGSTNYLYFQRVEASTTHTVMTIKRDSDIVLFASTPTVAGTAMVLTNDSRLSDSRTPTGHLITSHTGVSDYSIGVRNGAGAGSITEVSLASTNQVIGRLGAGVVAIDIGTGAGDVAAGDHTHSYLSTSGGTVDGDVQIGNASTDEWWLTLLGGVDTAERTGITMGESGKWGAAALHIYYTGDGYGHIGMGAMTGSTDAAYDHIRFKYNSANMDFYSAINHTADYVGTGNVTLNWGEVNNAFIINSGYGSADTDSFSITKYSSDNQFLLNSDSYLRMSSHFVPHANDVYDLGASSNKWRDLFVNDQITATGDGHSLGNTTITDLHISDTTTSTTTTTGAFTVAGGAGIVENLHVGGYVGYDASHYIDPWYGTLPNASYTGMRFSLYTATARGFWFGDSNDTTPTLFASPNFSGSGVRRVGINHVGSSTYTLYVSGSIGATTTITSYASDRTLKKNINTLQNPMETLRKIRGVGFEWNHLSTIESDGAHPDGEYDIGFIAQEIQEVLPELIVPWNKEKGLLSVRYDRIVPLLVESIKELDTEIQALRSELDDMKDFKRRIEILEKSL